MHGDLRRLLLGASLLTAACGGPQSALDPAGPGAASIHRLGMFMYVGAALVTAESAELMLTSADQEVEEHPDYQMLWPLLIGAWKHKARP